jgi:fructose-bisphosphate aldolase class II
MALADLRDMLYYAYAHRYAVGAFDAVSLEFLQGIMDAAERCRTSVIVSLSESRLERLDFEPLIAAVETAAQRATVPVAIHLGKGSGFESVVRAIKLGCNTATVKAYHEAFPEDLNRIRRIIEMAHSCGVPVEGELGDWLGIEEDVEHQGRDMASKTVAEAKAYVERTGIDFLAVSVGALHGRLKAKPEVDYQRLQQINAALGIPLAIDGGTGLSDDEFRRVIANGVTKINCFAALADAAGARIRDNRREEGFPQGYARLMRNVITAVSAEAERNMRL